MTTDQTSAPAPVRTRRRPKKAWPLGAEHRAIFESHLHTWQGKLGLNAWRVYLAKDDRPAKANAADVKIFYDDRVAKVTLADDIGLEPTSEKLEALALHELLHVLLGPLTYQEDAGVEAAAVAGVEHSVIHVLQQLLTVGRI